MCGEALRPAQPTRAMTGAFGGIVRLCANVRALDDATTSAIAAHALILATLPILPIPPVLPILPILPVLPIQVTF